MLRRGSFAFRQLREHEGTFYYIFTTNSSWADHKKGNAKKYYLKRVNQWLLFFEFLRQSSPSFHVVCALQTAAGLRVHAQPGDN